MCRVLFIGVMLWCAAALAAAPKAKADQGKKYLDAAIRLYNAFEFERALEQLGKARKASEGAEMDVAIALYEGMLQLELGRDEQAETAFKAALALDAGATLPAKVSPKVQSLFDRLKTEMAKPIPPPPPKEELKPAPVDNTPLGPLPPQPLTGARARAGPSRPLWVWAPAAAGVIIGGVLGPVFLLQAKDRSDKLSGRVSSAFFDLATAESYRDQGKLFQTLGFAAIGLGVALVAVTVVLFVMGGGS